MDKATANVGIKVSISLEDEFLKHEPRTEQERLFKERLINAINGEQKAQPVVFWNRQSFEREQHFKKQQTMLLGALIKKLVEGGLSIEKAWDAVCNDSTDVGYCRNPENAKIDIESDESTGLYGMTNTYKLLNHDEKNGVGWIML